ncbi:MAG: sigma 54-interacting transcriptional regulator, partial [candidate division Zixibacteria bacterium]|nr:sigma 54-interacting transcriptional regulator [candidate division Zixibacteria bacterium]
GTIFLDEIGDMPMELQSKLLQVLEQQEFVRVGGIHNIHVDVRIICATNINLEHAIAEKYFRDDLFYRLNEITLFLPSLRERKEDIPLLIDHFMKIHTKALKKDPITISPQVSEKMHNFSWPGNVRQLENMVRQAIVRNDDSTITDQILSNSQMSKYSNQSVSTNQVTSNNIEEEKDYSLKERIGKIVAEEEKKLISEVLKITNWNRRKASELLQISYRSLLYKISDYKLNSK